MTPQAAAGAGLGGLAAAGVGGTGIAYAAGAFEKPKAPDLKDGGSENGNGQNEQTDIQAERGRVNDGDGAVVTPDDKNTTPQEQPVVNPIPEVNETQASESSQDQVKQTDRDTEAETTKGGGGTSDPQPSSEAGSSLEPAASTPIGGSEVAGVVA
ncbi:hypothetical protein [Candidatus Mycoplasma haematohominis]|uniref:hypothetical protein n=1 Tax=Candidatus Mycoplasma haematohominis TaxID=1494318 RepID=UPI001C0A6A6C|nr:hypothetical protein [Candidatus Mycoplasma haemohominis]